MMTPQSSETRVQYNSITSMDQHARRKNCTDQLHRKIHRKPPMPPPPSSSVHLIIITIILFCIITTSTTVLTLVIEEPANIADEYVQVTAMFGPAPNTYSIVHTQVIKVDPFDACSDIQNNPSNTNTSLVRRIALISRGSCPFEDKAARAQLMGAVGVIIADNIPMDKLPILMQGSGDQVISIPTVSVTYGTLQALLTGLQESSQVIATLDNRGEYPVDRIQTISQASLLVMMLFTMSLFACGWALGHCIRRARDSHAQYQRTAALDRMLNVRYRRGDDGDDEENPPLLPPGAGDSATGVGRGGGGGAGGGVADYEAHTMNITRSATTTPAAANEDEEVMPLIHNEACSVCLEEFKDDEEIKVLPCRHGYHRECIEPWLRDRSDLCPMCKRSILSPAAASTPRR